MSTRQRFGLFLMLMAIFFAVLLAIPARYALIGMPIALLLAIGELLLVAP